MNSTKKIKTKAAYLVHFPFDFSAHDRQKTCLQGLCQKIYKLYHWSCFRPFNAWCRIRVHTLLNKPAGVVKGLFEHVWPLEDTRRLRVLTVESLSKDQQPRSKSSKLSKMTNDVTWNKKDVPVLPSYRNQSTDLHSKSINWFLYEGNNGI